MDDVPGMIRPDLQALPQVRDRMTFLYLEHCTLGRQDGAITVTLFPAHAGVIPPYFSFLFCWSSFPRTRGGDPTGSKDARATIFFSPHTRG